MSRASSAPPTPPTRDSRASSRPAYISPQVKGSSRSFRAGSSRPGLHAVGGAGSRCSAPGLVSGSSVVMPSLAEQDPEEQQDRGCEAHAGEILHRVVWGEGAQVSPAPSPGTGVCAQGTRLSGEDMAPSTAPDGDAVHPHSRL